MPKRTAEDQQLPVSRREQNKVDTRKRILAAASRLLAAHGLNATSAEAIAEAADVSRATFFNYFPSKAAVIAALVAKNDADFATTIEAELSANLSTAERIEHVFVLTAARLMAAPAVNKMILGESERGYSLIRQNGPRFNRMQALLRELLADGVARGEVRTDYPLELIAELVGGAYVAMLHSWRVNKKYPLEARMRASARFLAESIAPPLDAAVARRMRK